MKYHEGLAVSLEIVGVMLAYSWPETGSEAMPPRLKSKSRTDDVDDVDDVAIQKNSEENM